MNKDNAYDWDAEFSKIYCEFSEFKKQIIECLIKSNTELKRQLDDIKQRIDDIEQRIDDIKQRNQKMKKIIYSDILIFLFVLAVTISIANK